MKHLRRSSLPPINSIKHYVHRTNSTVASGALQTNVVVHSVVAPATATAADVKEGSIVKAIYCEFWIVSAGSPTTEAQFIIIVEKLPGNSTGITAAQALNLGAYPNKKNILYVSQGILGSREVTGAIPVIRTWVLIPKGKQRMGLDDQLLFHLAPVGQTIKACGIFTYKEYT